MINKILVERSSRLLSAFCPLAMAMLAAFAVHVGTLNKAADFEFSSSAKTYPSIHYMDYSREGVLDNSASLQEPETTILSSYPESSIITGSVTTLAAFQDINSDTTEAENSATPASQLAEQDSSLSLQLKGLILALVAILFVGVVLVWGRLLHNLESFKQANKDAEEKIHYLANSDALTGLSNRFSFAEKISAILQSSDNENKYLALLIINLDRFKPINDLFGHAVGDEVLVEVAERIKRITRDEDSCARFGGDEFVLTTDFSGDNDALISFGQRIINAVCEPIRVNEMNLQVGGSVGIAISSKFTVSYDDLMRKADIALNAAKNSGRGCVRIFDEQMDSDIKQRNLLREKFKDAIQSDQVVPYFQPIIDLRTGELSSLEILARWHHPTEGMLSPAAFIDDIIELDLIDELTMSLLEKSCDAVAHMPNHVGLSLNVAAKQLQNASTVEDVIEVISRKNFDAHRLKIEVTESALLSDLEQSNRLLSVWKDHGIRISIDDFGTGYSNLTYLMNLPFDELKIDRSFVSQMNEREECIKIVSTIIGLGVSLGLEVVGEGVEKRWQADLLFRHGCSKGQGYYYSKPVPASDLVQLMAA